MRRGSRPVYLALSVVAALAMLIAMIPALGDHLPNDAGTLHLHLGSDGQRQFVYTDGDGSVHTPQTIASPNRCELTITGPYAKVTGNAKGPGLSDDGIGVKSGGAQGTPCGRIDTSENLTVTLVGVPLASMADLDLELKGDAKILITAYQGSVVAGTFQVRSGAQVVPGVGVDGSSGDPYTALAKTDDPGTSIDESIANCRIASDSGPDAGSRDNCRVTVDSARPFDGIKVQPLAGEMSLEGSGDFGNNPANDTIFYLSDFDGFLDCGESTGLKTNGNTSANITRHQNLDGPTCTPKAYSLKAVDSATGEDTVTFELGDPSQVALYRADITFERPVAGLFDAVLNYDPDGSDGYTQFKEMPPCTDTPGEKTAASQDASVIPTGDQGCIVSVVQDYDGITTWDVLFFGDWRFK